MASDTSTPVLSPALQDLPASILVDTSNQTQHLGSAGVCGDQIFAKEPAWEVLELEYPDHIECYRCRGLHPVDEIHKYAKCSRSSDLRVRTAKFIHPNFSFAALRIIMKQYRQGKNCDKVLELLAYQSGPVIDGAQVKQDIATPRIVGGRLLMRLQTIYVVPSEGFRRTYLLKKNMVYCPHGHNYTPENKIVTKRLCQRFLAFEWVLVGYQEDVASWRCNYCPTEYRFSIAKFEGKRVVLIITKWLDLGTGLSPLDSDLPLVVGPPRDIGYDPMGEILAYESPRARFEGAAPNKECQAVSTTIGYQERIKLFAKYDSLRAQSKRVGESFRWSLRSFFQGDKDFPHLNSYAIRQDVKNDQLL